MRAIRSHSIELALLAILLSAIGYFAYLAYGLMPGSIADQEFSGSRALDHAQKLVAFGPRPAGSAGNQKAGDWLMEYVASQGWDIIMQPFTMTNGIRAQNIIAIRAPSTGNAPVALLTTHLDTRLYADGDLNPANHETSSVGANKGASGAALLAELARTIDVENSGHTICLAFFDAEENGGISDWDANVGSGLFLENLGRSAQRCANPRFALTVDLVGAANVRIRPLGTDNKIQQSLRAIASELGYATAFDAAPFEATTNNLNWFLQQGIESATIADYTYPFRDSLSDTIDKLDSSSFEKVGRTLEIWLERGGDFTTQ